jgi:formylmethanofuran dehydrogenase subunit C
MSEAITLSLKVALDRRVEALTIAPDRFATLSNAEIAALPVRLSSFTVDRSGSRTRVLPLGELFAVTGGQSTTVHVVGDLRLVDALGAGMAGGTLLVDGDVGRDVGRGMTGGAIEIHGSAGHGAGRTMAGGMISIHGDAGDGVGGPLPGGARGMTGGEILVRGNAARDAGFCVRRGLIVIGGDADGGSARSMIAGTVVVMGKAHGPVGCWNKRGTLVVLGGAQIPETYRYACTYRPIFLRLLFEHLRHRQRLAIDDRFVSGRYARYCGDLSELGLGELLTWAA